MKKIPFAFVLDELEPIAPYTKPMFGCLAVYRDEKILLILRERESHPADNGIWIATRPEHHAALREEFPILRGLELFGEGKGETSWLLLPLDRVEFEESAFRLCELLRAGDPRIGKVPASRNKRKKRKRA